MALKKLQTLLDSPGQYKARLNDAVSRQGAQKAAQPPPAANQLSPEDLQRVYQVRPRVQTYCLVAALTDSMLLLLSSSSTSSGRVWST